MWIYVYYTCILYTMPPDEQNTYASLIKKIIFLLYFACCTQLELCFHHHHSPELQPHTVSSFIPVAMFLFIWWCRCWFSVFLLTCCQLFNISKHMMSNKIFPLPYKCTFDHHFYTNPHTHMNAIRSILFIYTHHVENNEMVHLLFMWIFIPYRTHLLLSSCVQKIQQKTTTNTKIKPYTSTKTQQSVGMFMVTCIWSHE